MLDQFIQGGNYVYTDSRGAQTISFGQGLYQYRNRKFIENLGEYEYDADNSENPNNQSSLGKNKKKRIIIYTLQN